MAKLNFQHHYSSLQWFITQLIFIIIIIVFDEQKVQKNSIYVKKNIF